MWVWVCLSVCVLWGREVVGGWVGVTHWVGGWVVVGGWVLFSCKVG